MTPEEYKTKHKELQDLATSIDVWKQTTLAPKTEKEVRALYEKLQAETYDLECKFLEKKIEIFKEILEALKK